MPCQGEPEGLGRDVRQRRREVRSHVDEQVMATRESSPDTSDPLHVIPPVHDEEQWNPSVDATVTKQ